MPFYLLRYEDGSWDDTVGAVVRARSPDEARLLVSKTRSVYDNPEVWLDEKETTCSEIPIEGPAEVILEDIKEG